MTSVKKPLLGKKVYLDTKTPQTRITEDLKLLGASIEQFFSRDIWCVISDKITSSDDNLDPDSRQAGPSSQKSRSKSAPFLSRSQALLQAASKRKSLERQDDQSDKVQTIVAECKQWNISVLALKSAVLYVEKLKTKYMNALSPTQKKLLVGKGSSRRKHRSDAHLNSKTQKLDADGSFAIKIEEVRQKYLPVYKSFEEWPSIDRNSDPRAGFIFKGPAKKEARLVEQKQTTGNSVRQDAENTRVPAQSFNKSNSQKPVQTAEKRPRAEKSKLCELCHEHYYSLREHLTSSQHIRSTSKTNAFSTLESFLSENRIDPLRDIETMLLSDRSNLPEPSPKRPKLSPKLSPLSVSKNSHSPSPSRKRKSLSEATEPSTPVSTRKLRSSPSRQRRILAPVEA